MGFEDVPVPTPGEGEVLVTIRAASVNSWDYDRIVVIVDPGDGERVYGRPASALTSDSDSARA